MEKRLNIEELLAAGRAGITTLILPRHNEKDLVEVPRATLDKLHIVFVDEIHEAITAALGCGPNAALQVASCLEKTTTEPWGFCGQRVRREDFTSSIL
jgi:predicted ATP-dependent protease